MNMAEMLRWLGQQYRHQSLKRGPRIVAIGGGTGLPVLLRGLKQHTENLTAIVTVADDGGSSGRLRGEFGILPPGDIRNCLVALAETETLMDQLFHYRFDQGEGLAGHNLGNLLLTALTDIAGDFQTAILEASKVLKVRGLVLPSTLKQVILHAELRGGAVISGESRISQAQEPIRRVFLTPEECAPVPEALEAIAGADLILFGPGSLYTSVLPILLVAEIVAAVKRSPALKCYLCNIMTQPGETTGFKASDHLRAIYDHAGRGWIDYVLVNTRRITPEKQEKYARQGAFPVLVDDQPLYRMGVRLIRADVLEDGELVRHDPRKLSLAIMNVLGKGRRLPSHA